MLQELQGNGLELTTILLQRVRSDPEQDPTNHIEGQPIHPFGDIDRGPRLPSMPPFPHDRSGFVNHHLGKRGHLGVYARRGFEQMERQHRAGAFAQA